MSNLGDYVKQSFGRGVEKAQIEAELLKAGWTKDQIETVFSSIEFEQKQFIEKHKRKFLPSKKLLKIFFIIFFLFAFIYNSFLYVDIPNRCFVKIIPSIAFEFSNGNIKRAIKILRYGSPSDYQDFCKHVDTIDANIDCGGWEGGCFRHGKKIAISTSRNTVAWTAAIIVHETCHAMQNAQRRDSDETECYAADGRILESIIQF